MIVVDTSALMAIVLNEAQAPACRAALAAEPEVLISAGTLAEALIVAARRHVAAQMTELVEGLAFTVVPVSHAAARRIAAAYDRWGRGAHPAALNFGDCFAYELAKTSVCPLLCIGADFAQTDLPCALA